MGALWEVSLGEELRDTARLPCALSVLIAVYDKRAPLQFLLFHDVTRSNVAQASMWEGVFTIPLLTVVQAETWRRLHVRPNTFYSY